MSLERLELLTPVDSDGGRTALRERYELAGATDHAAERIDGRDYLVEAFVAKVRERVRRPSDVLRDQRKAREATRAALKRQREARRSPRPSTPDEAIAAALGVSAADVVRAMADLGAAGMTADQARAAMRAAGAAIHRRPR